MALRIDSLTPSASWPPCDAGEQPGRAQRQVAVVERHVLDALAGDLELELVGLGPLGVDVVVERDRVVDGGQRVVAVGPRARRPSAPG